MESDQIQTILNVADGKLEGPLERRDANGRSIMRAQFRQGRLEGMLMLFGPDGAPERQMNFLNGQLHGTTKIFDRSGGTKHVQFDNGEYQEQMPPVKTSWYRQILMRLGLGRSAARE